MNYQRQSRTNPEKNIDRKQARYRKNVGRKGQFENMGQGKRRLAGKRCDC